jgi:hypothetical protein
MQPFIATVFLAVILIAMSAWGFLSSDNPSFTALIPAAFGVVLAACSLGVKKDNKVVAHVAVLLVVLLIVALFMPLKGAIGRGDTLAVVRVSTMLVASVGTLAVYILSFVRPACPRRDFSRRLNPSRPCRHQARDEPTATLLLA